MSSGTVAVWAMKDGDYEPTEFAGTTAGLQAAIDYLAGGKGKVFVGPGTLEITSSIKIHTGCHLQGSGIDISIIKRAAGTVADGGAAHSADVIVTTPYGSSTVSDSTTIQYDIAISDITLDDNQSDYSATVTDSNLGLSGIWAADVDGLVLSSVKIINTLRSALFLAECKNVFVDNLWLDTVGQWATSSTRNGIDLYNFNDGASASDHGRNVVISNFNIKDVGDEAISISRMEDVSISNGVVDGCDLVLEFIPPNSAGALSRNITVDNIAARNHIKDAIKFPMLTSGDFENITIANCEFLGHSSANDGGAVHMQVTSGKTCNLTNISVINCHFRNINTTDTNAQDWVDMDNIGNGTYENISFRGCSFSGKSGSTRTADLGIKLKGAAKNVVFSGLSFKDVPGIGALVQGQSGLTTITERIYFSDCAFDTLTSHGTFLGANATTATLKEIFFDRCTVRDCATQGTSNGFTIQNTAAGSTSRIHIRDCRVIKDASGGTTRGVRLDASSGTVTTLFIVDNDFDTTDTPYSIGTAPTDVRFDDIPYKGSDIASSNNPSIGRGSFFTITGTSDITGFTPYFTFDRRAITFLFSGTAATSGLVDGGTLKLASTLAYTPDDTITLRWDGTNWYEVSRSAN